LDLATGLPGASNGVQPYLLNKSGAKRL